MDQRIWTDGKQSSEQVEKVSLKEDRGNSCGNIQWKKKKQKQNLNLKKSSYFWINECLN